MDNQFAETWQKMSQVAVTAAKELETINTELLKGLTGNQMAFANAAFESGSRYVAALSNAKDIQNIAAEHTKAYGELNESVLDSMRSSAEILGTARTAYQCWFEKAWSEFPVSADFTLPGLNTKAKPAAKKAA